MNVRISALALIFTASTTTLALALATADDFQTIYAAKNPSGWVTNKGKPLPAENAQEDGLNPHKSGGYIVMYEKPVKNFILDFDYKLSRGCNSGVFIRVGDPKDPVMTGIEIAIDDTTGTGVHDTGAIYDLVQPKVNAQKPVGEWNHMTISARGSKIEVELNGQAVSAIDLNEWIEAGKRPDGSSHKFRAVTFKEFDRSGHFGFQDHGQDCWYRNVRLKSLN